MLEKLPKEFGAINVGGSMLLNNNLLKKIPLSFSKGSVGDSLYLNSNIIDNLDESFKDFTFSGVVDLSFNIDIFSKRNKFSKKKLKKWFNCLVSESGSDSETKSASNSD